MSAQTENNKTLIERPLAEIFGYRLTDDSEEAKIHRAERLCPFNNKVSKCTKDKAEDPLGVCSIYHNNKPVITCPVRFRQDWRIARDAASFFFPESARWRWLTEVRLNDATGKSAGNIDMVLVSCDEGGRVIDFGALEIQAVYISGNVRELFDNVMHGSSGGSLMRSSHYPRPDYLSSSRKRLVPQLLYKGGILRSWQKKIAVALQKSFFDTLPPLNSVPKEEAELAWLIYDLELRDGRYQLDMVKEVFTKFESTLLSMTTPAPGKSEDFVRFLQAKIDENL